MHSAARGPAIGGCRIKPYRSVGDGVADALRLSRAMTLKCGLAELPHGGGKSVVVLGDAPLTPPVRENLVLDQSHRLAGEREQLTVLCLTETLRRARTYDAYLTDLAATTESDADLVGVIVAGPRNQVTKLTKRLPPLA
ncbi:Glu/Leu/Phe/Val dehydrogenase dimerization domain-containing protein [Nonomuraea fuscirosea]|uniref:Glu/Leu/Phe/Val dehydrogenase dimerization domain-containing protein n=1 Tax=Nonomuraea fuscirosea TaxID=1291556 RepID=UPI0034217CC9